MTAPRRVITGLDDQGRSTVIIDGPVPHFDSGAGASVVWRSGIPADNSGSADTAAPYDIAMLHDGQCSFTVAEFAPGTTEAFMHATDTIDYIVMLKGEVTFVVETGEVTLKAHDLLVDRGIVHGWRNDGTEPALVAVVNLPSLPVGKGRTL
jgi:quercetin dioxygenase-like cupin family protein